MPTKEIQIKTINQQHSPWPRTEILVLGARAVVARVDGTCQDRARVGAGEVGQPPLSKIQTWIGKFHGNVSKMLVALVLCVCSLHEFLMKLT